jgi:hypothetical protein
LGFGVWGLGFGVISDFTLSDLSSPQQYLMPEYYTAANANVLTDTFYIVTRSKYIVKSQVRPIFGSPTNKLELVPSILTSAIYFDADANFYHINTDIGSNDQFFAYAGFYKRPVVVGGVATNIYSQAIKVRMGVAGPTYGQLYCEMQFDTYYFSSVAIHPTDQVLYLYANDGRIFSLPFAGGSFGSMTLLTEGFTHKMAHIFFVSPNRLLIKTLGTLAMWHTDTNSGVTLVDKIAFSRIVVGATKELAMVFNKGIRVIDLALPGVIPGYIFQGAVKEIITSKVSARPYFYVLTAYAISVYSFNTNALVASKSIGDLTQLLTSQITQIIALNDIDILYNSPTWLAVLAYVQPLSGPPKTLVVLLQDTTLVLGPFVMSTSSVNFQQLAAHKSASDATLDGIVVVGPNRRFLMHYQSTNPLVITVDDEAEDEPQATIDTASIMYERKDILGMGYFKLSNLEVGGVFRPRFVSRFINSFIVWSGPSSMQFSHLYNYHPEEFQVFVEYNNQPKFQFISILVGSTFLFTITSPTTWYGTIFSTALRMGTIFMSTNDVIYHVGWDDSMHTIGESSCFGLASESEYPYFSWTNCQVANCEHCNFMNTNYCYICMPGYFLQNNGTSCVAACNPGQYSLASPASCFSECPIEYFQDRVSFTCVTNAQCSTNSGSIFGRYCVPTASCPVPNCICSTVGSFPHDGVNSCTTPTQCPIGTFHFLHFNSCSAPIAGYVTTPTDMYCDPTTHYFVMSNSRCSIYCPSPLLRGFDNVKGKVCVTTSECLGLGMLADDPTLSCVSACPETAINGRCARILTLSSIACQRTASLSIINIQAKVVYKLDHTISPGLLTLSNPLSLTISCSPTSNCISSPLSSSATLIAAGTLSLIASTNLNFSTAESASLSLDSTQIHMADGQLSVFDPAATYTCALTPQPLINVKLLDNSSIPAGQGLFIIQKIATVSAASLSTIKIVLPFVFITLSSFNTLGILCLVAQSYTKLMTITQFAFTLDPDHFATSSYYAIFKEFFDGANEAFLSFFFNSKTINENRQAVCKEALLWKLCWLGVDDNFWLSHLLTLAIFFAYAALMIVCIFIARLLKKTSWAKVFTKRLTHILWPSYFLENGIGIWSGLLITVRVTSILSPILGVFKLLGLVTLLCLIFQTILILLFDCSILGPKKLHQVIPSLEKKISNESSQESEQTKVNTHERVSKLDQLGASFSNLYLYFFASPLRCSKLHLTALKVFMLHDIIFSIILILGPSLETYHCALWLPFEIVILILAIYFKPFSSFRHNFLLFSVQVGFIGIFVCILLKGQIASTGVLLFSLFVLFLDVFFTAFEFGFAFYKYIHSRRTPHPIAKSSSKLVNRLLTNSKILPSNYKFSKQILTTVGKTSTPPKYYPQLISKKGNHANSHTARIFFLKSFLGRLLVQALVIRNQTI